MTTGEWIDLSIAIGTAVLAMVTLTLVVATICASHADRVAARRPVIVVRPTDDGHNFWLENVGYGPALETEVRTDAPSSPGNEFGTIAVREQGTHAR